MNREMAYFPKCDFLRFFHTFLLWFGSLQGHYMYLLNIRFALLVFVAKSVLETIRSANILTCFKLYSRNLSPMPLPAMFKKWVG